jgi:hypothetical protein
MVCKLGQADRETEGDSVMCEQITLRKALPLESE